MSAKRHCSLMKLYLNVPYPIAHLEIFETLTFICWGLVKILFGLLRCALELAELEFAPWIFFLSPRGPDA